MTEKIIDQFLDECEVTPGPWEHEHRVKNIKESTIGSYSLIFETVKAKDETLCRVNAAIDAKIIAASRQSMKDWIMTAWELYKKGPLQWSLSEAVIYERAVDNIESALSMPWPDVRKRLEEIQNER